METGRTRTVRISLAKAMKIKNRLAGRLGKTQQMISTYNSVLEGRKDEVNVEELDKLRAQLSSALVGLKTAINDASRGIQRAIYELAEKKGEIEFLNGLNTRHGTEPAYGLHSSPQVYVASIKMEDVTRRVKTLEREIDELQDRIDGHNSSPERVEIDASVIELAS